MSERGRIALIFGTVAVLVGGGAYYFFGVYQPKQVRAKARTEIEGWEARYAEARRCLLGAAPASVKAGEALAIRELSPESWNRGTCTKLISALSRGDAEDTGLAAVEDAWHDIDKAAGKVAAGFASHIDPDGDAPAHRKADPLPGALDELEAVHAALRAAAGMAAPVQTAPGALRAAEVIAIADGAEPVTALESWSMPSVGSVIGFGRTKAREVQLVLAPGAAPALQPVASGVLRTVPDSAWGAGGMPGGVEVGALDAAGAPSSREVTKIPGQASVFAVVGTPADGLVVAGNRQQLYVLHAQGAKLTVDKPLAIAQLAFALDPAGRALIGFADEAGKARAFVARGGAALAPVELGDGEVRSACLTATHAWVGGGDQFVSFAEGSAPVPHVLPSHELLGCTDHAALLHKLGAAHYTVCTESCRIAQLQAMRPSSVGTIAGDKVVGVVARGTVLGVWREAAPPVYFAVPEGTKPLLATSNGKVIDIASQTDAGIVIIRVPVS